MIIDRSWNEGFRLSRRSKMTKEFDLNIERILENWEVYHAVREIIANALDEQKLTGTGPISIHKEGGIWHITDYGRGLNYHHLTQNENDEKLNADDLIGKFGVGLKDSLAVFYRNNIHVVIRSRYGIITLKQMSKEGFDDITTLHAVIDDPDDPDMAGTDFSLEGCTDDDIEKAKQLFLCFSGETVLEETGFGEVLEKTAPDAANIYIHGVKVAEESNFLFSYNITKLPAKLRKALNRERTNVGRSAYSDTVKNILKSVEDEDVLKALMTDLGEVVKGRGHDEMSWIDVQMYVAEQLSRTNDKLLFVTGEEAISNRMDISDAQDDDGYAAFIIPDRLRDKVGSIKTVTTVEKYNRKKADSFSAEAIDIKALSPSEQKIYNMMPEILNFMDGLPGVISAVKVSEELYSEDERSQAVGLWDPKTRIVWIKRSQLRSVEEFAGTLIHECTHATSREDDVSRAFEEALTRNLGRQAAYHLR